MERELEEDAAQAIPSDEELIDDEVIDNDDLDDEESVPDSGPDDDPEGEGGQP